MSAAGHEHEPNGLIEHRLRAMEERTGLLKRLMLDEPIGIVHRTRDLERLARIQLRVAAVVGVPVVGLAVEAVFRYLTLYR